MNTPRERIDYDETIQVGGWADAVGLTEGQSDRQARNTRDPRRLVLADRSVLPRRFAPPADLRPVDGERR
jgi:hypothetical protein